MSVRTFPERLKQGNLLNVGRSMLWDGLKWKQKKRTVQAKKLHVVPQHLAKNWASCL